MTLKTKKFAVLIALLVFSSPIFAAMEKDVLKTYTAIAHAVYEDSLISAQELRTAVQELISNPTEDNLAAAKEAWQAARVPYQQSEVYRFGNAVVDDWEGKVNAWPLDEGMIDYVDASYGSESEENPGYVANVIANPMFDFSGEQVDASEITTAVIESLHELGGVEANVATGYHAIEFLLWGQDLNGTGPGAGMRPASDLDPAYCTGGNCERRVAYLQAATDLLISDLEWIVNEWSPEGGAAQNILGGEVNESLAAMMIGMGSLSYGELAGERMQLGLLLHDPEEEHDCFSDNTHFSHYYDALGIRNIYLGSYERIDGSTVEGASLSDLVAGASADVDSQLRGMLDDTMAKMDALVQTAESDQKYDQMLGDGNDGGNAVVQAAIDALVAQTSGIEAAAAALNLDLQELEGSDSLDNPAAVFE